VAVSLGVIGALGFALGDRDEKVPSYPSTQALGRDINAHGIGCARVYPIRTLILADHDAANCEVGSATVTLNVWGVSPPPIDLREASRHAPWVVGPNWLVATTNRLGRNPSGDGDWWRLDPILAAWRAPATAAASPLADDEFEE
jgi:hypothetical protein